MATMLACACVPNVCQNAQAKLANVRETGSTWEFPVPRIDVWGYLAHPFSNSKLCFVFRLLLQRLELAA
jgi:hypothetical protein